MYLKAPIRWLIDLDRDGNLIGFVSTVVEGEAKGRAARGKEFLAPHVPRSSAVRAKLLADNAEYVLGIARDEAKRKRVDQGHRAFVEQVRACATATGEESVQAVLRFLEGLDRASLSLPEDLNPSHVLTFRVDGILPIDLKSVQDFWAGASRADKSSSKPMTRARAGRSRRNGAKTDLMQCLICGEKRRPVKRLPFKVKRIPGGQTAGMALISANVPAFESYGLEASLIAPTCADCGERFSKAANALIEGPETHITVGPLVYLFWTRADDGGFSFASLLSRPRSEDVRELIASVFGGREAAVRLDDEPFFATAFSASGGRLAVRDWVDTTVGAVRRNLARYFRLQRLVDWDGKEGEPFALFELAAATVRDVNRELPPNVPQALIHVALNGGPVPSWLLYHAVRRNRAEQRITRRRAALIKMVLLSRQLAMLEEHMVQLNDQDQHPAYLCGRLLAVLEAVQRAAIPEAGSTITDRFFGTASSAPATVFGRLIRGSQAHLSKLRRERPGTYEALEKKLEVIQAGLKSFPKTLTLEAQGLFGLGYYHQRAADRADRTAAVAAKRVQEAQSPTTAAVQ